MDDSQEARRQLAGRLFEAGGRPLSPDDPIFDVVFIAREVAREEHARLTQDLETLATAIAETLARESARLQAVAADTRGLIEKLEKTAERLEAAEAARKQNGPAQVGLLVQEINKVFTQQVREAVQAVQAGAPAAR
jgi:arginine deiminase